MTLAPWALGLAVFIPVIGACVVAFLPPTRPHAAVRAGIVISAVALASGVFAAASFDYATPGAMQAEANLPWITPVDVRFHIGVDGISLPLLLLSLVVRSVRLR